MRRGSASEFVSLDGVVQAPADRDDTAGGFLHGGWHAPYWSDGREGGFR
jgi:hypothetical protein